MQAPIVRGVDRSSSLRQNDPSDSWWEGETTIVLVVDDDDGVRSLVRAVLRRHGHEVVTARDGAEALEKIRDNRFHLILLDLMMPRMDGLEVIRRVSENGSKTDAMIVVMTAADDSLLAQLDRRRVHGVIRKPFDIEELAEIVTDSIRSREQV